MDHEHDAADWQGQEARVVAAGVAWMLDLLVGDLEFVKPGISVEFADSLERAAALTDHLHPPGDDWSDGKLKMFIENVLFSVSLGARGRPPSTLETGG